MNLMQVGCFCRITDIFIIQPESPIFLYSLQTMSPCDILAYITVGRGERNLLYWFHFPLLDIMEMLTCLTSLASLPASLHLPQLSRVLVRVDRTGRQGGAR